MVLEEPSSIVVVSSWSVIVTLVTDWLSLTKYQVPRVALGVAK
ncbi:hypothetical protein [Limosilactobacillus fermentum]